MVEQLIEVEAFTKFSESLIWQLNRDYYQGSGIDAWSKGVVPHQITSNSLVGRTYAQLIIGFLKDLASKGAVKETVYIVELGAGHGRLGYHILKHLDVLIDLTEIDLPPYCYVLTDIVEDNLVFFKDHPQLQPYFDSGELDYAYYDAINGHEITLRHAEITIKAGGLNQSMIAIANYFFDSIPTDLYYVQENKKWASSVAIHATQGLASLKKELPLEELELTFQNNAIDTLPYASAFLNTLLEDYQSNLSDSYVFFPEKGIKCLKHLRALSTKGMMLLSMDKGFHELEHLDNMSKPDMITHGSMSFWVNYHALGAYCEHTGGMSLFPSYSNFHVEVVCLLFTEDAASYVNIHNTYHHAVDNFGPDDFNTIKKLSYENSTVLNLMHLIALIRLSAYDSTFFVRMLPQVKKQVKSLTSEERERISETLEQVWSHYFNINEGEDLALTIAGIFFDLGFYDKALTHYQHSTAIYGIEMDTCYNKILCYYQLRQDTLFTDQLDAAHRLFPDTDFFEKLDKLDLSIA